MFAVKFATLSTMVLVACSGVHAISEDISVTVGSSGGENIASASPSSYSTFGGFLPFSFPFFGQGTSSLVSDTVLPTASESSVESILPTSIDTIAVGEITSMPQSDMRRRVASSKRQDEEGGDQEGGEEEGDDEEGGDEEGGDGEGGDGEDGGSDGVTTVTTTVPGPLVLETTTTTITRPESTSRVTTAATNTRTRTITSFTTITTTRTSTTFTTEGETTVSANRGRALATDA